MRKFFVFSFIMIGPLVWAAPRPQPVPMGPKINVLLDKEANSAFLEVKGAYRVIRKDSGSILSFGNIGKRFVVHAIQEGLRWGEEYPDVYQVSIIPSHPDTFVYVNGIQYKGIISIYHVRDNRITIVNEVPIEDFLKSTLAIKLNSNPNNSLHKEAMAALVIAARTDVYSCVHNGKNRSRPWEVTAKETGYYGYGVTHQKNNVEEAIDATRFMILESSKEGSVLQNGQLTAAKAEELAELGFDAKKILQTVFPKKNLGLTIDSELITLKQL